MPEGRQTFCAPPPLDENPNLGSPRFVSKYVEDYLYQSVILPTPMSKDTAAAENGSLVTLPSKRQSLNCFVCGLTPANVTDGICKSGPRCTTLAADVSSGVEEIQGHQEL
jgi:phosphoribosylanthranilate isomerase